MATFGLVCFAWIFFRAADVTTAVGIIGSIGNAFYSGTAQLLGAPGQTVDAAMSAAFFHDPRFYFAVATVALFTMWD